MDFGWRAFSAIRFCGAAADTICIGMDASNCCDRREESIWLCGAGPRPISANLNSLRSKAGSPSHPRKHQNGGLLFYTLRVLRDQQARFRNPSPGQLADYNRGPELTKPRSVRVADNPVKGRTTLPPTRFVDKDGGFLRAVLAQQHARFHRASESRLSPSFQISYGLLVLPVRYVPAVGSRCFARLQESRCRSASAESCYF